MLDFWSISIFQWVGFFFGILYIVFAAFNKNQCWIYSIISTIAIALEDFVNLNLYFDGMLQLFYAFIAIMGLYVWLAGGGKETNIRISSLGLSKNFGYFAIALLISIPTGYIMDLNSDAAFPYLDGFTSILAVFATFLMVYKIIETWSYWVLIDIICVYLYFSRGAELISLLYFVYLILAFVGWRRWNKMYKENLSFYLAKT
jgi:nicotinamide mononucleotide transporter